MRLPDELAPRLREAAERLLAEVGLADGDRPDQGKPERGKCWKCGRHGPLSLHHLRDGTVVQVHKRCHRKLHGQAGKRSRKR
jgi:hypothetical protein